jgi:single-stranded-DNA-specific exonuclease
MSKTAYLKALEEGIARLRAAGPHVTLVHHNDCDGLTAGAVLETALVRDGFSVDRIPLERIHPPIVARIHDRVAGGAVVYADLAGRAAPEIGAINADRSFTLILDHHPAEASTSETVLNLSTERFDLSGEDAISAATAVTLFASLMDERNADLRYLGVIGAIGDAHDRAGRLVGENREALFDAVAAGDVRIDAAPDGRETYTLTRFTSEVALTPFAKSLTTLGAAGYALGGPEVGIRACLDGPSPAYEAKREELGRLKEERFTQQLRQLVAHGLTKTPHHQWFVVGDGFSPMGVKIIGEFCMDIRDEPFMDPARYIAGFQDMPDEIPGLGRFEWDLVKVSMRVPSALGKRIVDGEMPGLDWLLPEAARRVGGSIDACHGYAAASLIPRGREAELIDDMDQLLAGKGR